MADGPSTGYTDIGDFRAAHDSGGTSDFSVGWIEDIGSYAIAYPGSVEVLVSYDDIIDFDADVDDDDTPEASYEFVPVTLTAGGSGGGGTVVRDSCQGGAVRLSKFGRSIVQGTPDADDNYTLIIPRVNYFESPSDGEVDSDQLISVGDI